MLNVMVDVGLCARRARPQGRTAVFALALLSLFASTAAPRLALAETKPLVEAGFRVLYLAPVFVAMSEGMMKKHGVDLTFHEISSGALGPATLVSGSAQVSDLEIKQVANLAAQGKHLLLFYNLVQHATLDLIVRNDVLARKGYDSKAPLEQKLKVLKGLTFGITAPGAPTDSFARYFLERAGYDPARDATMVQIGGVPALEAAFRAGRIDAFILSPPLPQKLERDGVGTIVVHNTLGEAPELSDASTTSLATSADYAKAHPDMIRAYSAAISEAVKWMNAHPDEALKDLSAKWFKDTKPADLKIALQATLPALSETGRFTEASLRRDLHVSQAIGEHVKADLTEGVLWTNAYLSPK